MAHNVVKPEVLASTAAQLVAAQLTIPNLFTKRGVEDFRGAKDDTLTVPVKGVLPHRKYGWRNDRTNPIVLDEYTERSIAVTFGDNYYSGSPLTDEQRDFDTTAHSGPVEVRALEAQAEAVATGIQYDAVSTVENGTYEVELVLANETAAEINRVLVEARRVLDRFHAPKQGRVLVVGSDIDAAIQRADLFNIASNVGDASARSALQEAVIGRWKEFTIITATEIEPDTAYVITPGGFVFLNAAPAVPNSVGFGATSSHEGIALRVMKDYDPMHFSDRLVTNTYAGFRQVEDPLLVVDKSTGNASVTDEEYFVRGLKISMSGEVKYPEPGSELADATGVTDPNADAGTGDGGTGDA